MKSFTELAIRRPITVLMIFVCLGTIGLISVRLLPLEFFPSIEFPGVFIQIPYQNSSPEEVERHITRPVEEALATLGGVERMRSESREDGAWVFLFFGWGEDITVKGVEARDKIDAIRHLLPEDVERVLIRKFATDDQPVLTLRISSERDLSGAYDMLDRNLKRRIERLEGVSKVELYGVSKKQLRIELDAGRVAAHGVDLNELRERLMQANFSVTAGRVTDRGKRYFVHPIGEYQSMEEVANQIVGDNGLRLRDIANVRYQFPVLTYGRHLNQRYAIGLNVFKETGANIVAISERTLKEIDEISKLPEMKGVSLYAMDNQGQGVKDSLADLLQSGLIGALFSVLVLYFFLRQLPMTLVVTLAVPFSIMITLGFMYFFGFSLNILTMMGLMLSIGMLVDNAVVVTESIFRYRQEHPGDMRKASVLGVNEVATAVTAGTLTTIIVFLPNVFGAQNNITIFLSHVAITICVALVASLAISRTLIPLLTSYLPGNPATQHSGIVTHVTNAYVRVLRWTLAHPRWMTLFILLIIASVVPPAMFVKNDMFPSDEGRRLFLRYNVNGQYALSKVEATVDVIEKYLFEHKDEFEIESVYSYYDIGRAESTLLLRDDEGAKKPATEIQKAIRDGLPKIAIGSPSFEQKRAGAADKLGVHILGESSERLAELTNDVSRVLHATPGLADIRVEKGAGDWEVRVIVHRDRARKYGLSSQTIAEAISTAMRGQKLRAYRGESGEIEMLLQFQRSDRVDLDQLLQIPIRTPAGENITLSSVARWETGDVPGTITREDRATAMTIETGLDEITADEGRERIKEVMDKLQFPPGYHWSFSRGFNKEDESQVAMLVNMLLAIAMIYIVMAALFESLLYPTSIITSILFSVIGVYWLFWLTGTTFSFMALIGILVLMGVVVNNGIVLIDHINHLRGQGLSREQAILQGGRDRLRPILMTVGTTILGLLPLSMGDAQLGDDGPPYFPMARAIIGGLAFSTVVSLIVLPSIYVGLDKLSAWGSRRWRRSHPMRPLRAWRARRG